MYSIVYGYFGCLLLISGTEFLKVAKKHGNSFKFKRKRYKGVGGSLYIPRCESWREGYKYIHIIFHIVTLPCLMFLFVFFSRFSLT